MGLIHTLSWVSWLVAFLLFCYAVERHGRSPYRHFASLAVFVLAAVGYVSVVWVLGSMVTTVIGAAVAVAMVTLIIVLRRRAKPTT